MIDSNEIVKQNIYEIQISEFENKLITALGSIGLPTDNIFVPSKERETVFRNITAVIDAIPEEIRARSIYISKFLSAVAGGLFDAALNYLWDETILELRKRVELYDLAFFFDNASIHEEKRKKLSSQDDLLKLDDSELITGARNIGLISELGFKHLDYIRYMRNWASAAHPNQNQLSGLQLISWLETCFKEVIALPFSSVAVKIKQLLGNIKANTLTIEEAKKIAAFFIDIHQADINNLASGFFGIYTSLDSPPTLKQNIVYLLPYLWGRVSEETRKEFGVKYANYVANNDQHKSESARQFLEFVHAVAYIPDGIRAAEIETALLNLLSVHNSSQNFYNEPVFARQLLSLVGDSPSIPFAIQDKYVVEVVYVYLTNGYGIAWNAEPIYLHLINNFNSNQASTALLSFNIEKVSSRLQFSLCRQKYANLITLLRPKISSPAFLELLDTIERFGENYDKLKDDSRVKRLLTNIQIVINK